MGIGKVVPQVFKDDLAEVERKRQYLEAELEKKNVLKKKLKKKFKLIYFGVRVSLVSIWFGVLAGFYFLGQINSLEDFLNYTELSVLLILSFNFLTFGSIKDFKAYMEILKTRTQIWVYGGYIDLDDQINAIEIEKTRLESVD